MAKIIVVGRSRPELRNWLAEQGHGVIELLARDVSDRDNYIKTDFADEAAIRKSVNNLGADGVLWVFEDAVVPASIVANQLHLHAPPIDSAVASRDKFIMRERFAESDASITVEHREVNSEADLESAVAEIGLPIVLKPSNLMKSLFISVNHTLEEAKVSYQEMLDGINNLKSNQVLSTKTRVVAEQFMQGNMYTVVTFVDKYKNTYHAPGIVSIKTARDIGIDDGYLFSRTIGLNIDNELKNDILLTAEKGIEALGLKSCITHVEMFDTEDGLKLIEIASRIGGYRERMYKLAYEIELFESILDLSLGKIPRISEYTPEEEIPVVSVIELFPRKVTTKIMNIKEQINKLGSLFELRDKTKGRQSFGPAKDGYKAAYIVILRGSEEQVSKDHSLLSEIAQSGLELA